MTTLTKAAYGLRHSHLFIYLLFQVYSAVETEQKGGGGTTSDAAGMKQTFGIIPHAKQAEQQMRQQRQAERAAGGGTGTADAGGSGNTLSRSSLFRKKVHLVRDCDRR